MFKKDEIKTSTLKLNLFDIKEKEDSRRSSNQNSQSSKKNMKKVDYENFNVIKYNNDHLAPMVKKLKLSSDKNLGAKLKKNSKKNLYMNHVVTSEDINIFKIEEEVEIKNKQSMLNLKPKIMLTTEAQHMIEDDVKVEDYMENNSNNQRIDLNDYDSKHVLNLGDKRIGKRGSTSNPISDKNRRASLYSDLSNYNLNNLNNKLNDQDKKVPEQPLSSEVAFKNLNATVQDFENLNIEERNKYDYRNFWEYLKDLIIMDNTILSLFFKRSLFHPIHIRVMHSFTFIMIIITINTILFSDADISERQKLDINPAVS